ncbi:MAG: NADPH:quinone oxidoreductase family protein [Sterolibacterium sp.]
MLPCTRILSMKALTCTAFGCVEDLVLAERPSLQPGAREVVIAVEAASINHADVLLVQGRYQIRPPLPFTPGSELAGVVKAVGAGVRRYQPGDRVIAWCGQGGLATECATAADRVMRLPAGMSYEQGASFLVCFGTALYGLKNRGRIRGGETLLVLGAAGGLGLAAIQVGKKLGARVIAAASSEDRLALCREAGADDTVNYNDEKLNQRVLELTAGWGADIILDPLGGAYTEQVLRVAAPGGRLLTAGFASGGIPCVPLNLALLGNRSILGISWGDFVRSNPTGHHANVRLLKRWFAEGSIHSIIDERLPLSRAVDAMARMAARQVKGKVIVLPGSAESGQAA